MGKHLELKTNLRYLNGGLALSDSHVETKIANDTLQIAGNLALSQQIWARRYSAPPPQNLHVIFMGIVKIYL
jgi:hypothetical protein